MDKNIFKKFSYGLYIVSTKDNDTLSGCVVNTAVQITSQNPLIAVSVNKENYTNEIIKKSKKLAINVLSKNVNKEIINKFGFYSSKEVSKFDNIEYEIINNVPVIKEGSCGYLIGDVVDIVDCESHDIFLVRVSASQVLRDDEALTYKYYQENMKGRSPSKAPTYVEEVENTSSSKYRCLICGHIYDDAKEDVPFASLPDDWVCPVCGVGKDKFEKIS